MDHEETLVISSLEECEKFNFFKNNNSITEVQFCILGESEINIPERMFFHCINLRKVTFNNPVNKIGSDAFSCCEKLCEVVFNAKVKEIGEGAFYDIPLTSIEFINDVILHENAFGNCGNAGETLTFIIKDDFHQIKNFSYKNSIGCYVKRDKSSCQSPSIKKSTYPINLKATNFNVVVKKKTLLSNVNISVEPGEMIMVIGGSGAGKSTLMKNLFGVEPSKNYIYVECNGHDAKGAPMSTKVKKILGNHVFYSPQFTVSNEFLTVEQEIQRNAEMYIRRRLSEKELKKIAQEFNFNDELFKVLVKDISGGQKKKLLYVTSQLCNPQIYVFDEPDSGLDEPSAFNFYIKLRRVDVNEKGRTVIVISHHPHNFMSDFNSSDSTRIPFENIFTRLIVLAKINDGNGGTIAFDGSPTDARKFFGLHSNDPYSRIVSKIMNKNEGGESTEEEVKSYIEKFKKGGGK